MKYVSTFTGIGGFELGIGAEHECVGYSEVDRYACNIYQHHFPTHQNYGDITKIDAASLPDFDLLVGEFPCQAFSIAGKRRGFQDTRGTLFFDLARILQAKQPRLFVFENVKGLLSHNDGQTFRTIIATLAELGYDVQWQVLNSKNHGVPQNRERVFIVGHLRGSRRPEVFPLGEGDSRTDEARNQEREVVAHTLRAKQGGPDLENSYLIPEATQMGYAEAHVGDSINLSVPNSTTPRGRVGKGIAQTLDTGMQQYTIVAGNQRGEVREMPISGSLASKKSSSQFSYLLQRPRGKNKGGKHDIAPTMTGSEYHHNNHVAGARIRRLTPTECERLQGFPDGWTGVEGTSDTQRYKTLGNAVTVNVVRDVMRKLLAGDQDSESLSRPAQK